MKKIETLTSEQKAAMPRYVEAWLKHGLSTEPANRERAEAAIRWMYEQANLKQPTIVWCDSPLSMILTKSVWDSVGDSVRDSVWTSVRDSVRDSVWDSVRDSVWASVWDSVRDSVWASVWASVRTSVRDSVRDSVWASVRDSVRDSVWASVRDSVWASVYGQHEAGWLSFYDFFRRECGLTGETEPLNGLTDLAKSCGWILPCENICFASERHYICSVDENGLVHSETGPAIAYRDGFEVHAWHGVSVPREWIESADTLDPNEVLRAENVGQRAAGIAVLGMARMLDRLDHKVIDSDPDPMRGDLIEVRLADLPDPGFYLRAQCPRNGTIMEPVNTAEMEELTVKAAQAWRVGLPVSEFQYPERRT